MLDFVKIETLSPLLNKKLEIVDKLLKESKIESFEKKIEEISFSTIEKIDKGFYKFLIKNRDLLEKRIFILGSFPLKIKNSNIEYSDYDFFTSSKESYRLFKEKFKSYLYKEKKINEKEQRVDYLRIIKSTYYCKNKIKTSFFNIKGLNINLTLKNNFIKNSDFLNTATSLYIKDDKLF